MSSNSKDNSREVDLRRILLILWESRRTLVLIGLVFFITGLFFAFFAEKRYRAESVLIPETNNSNGSLGGNISGIASLAGINLGGGNMNNDMFPPYLYPKIMENIDFQLELINSKFYLNSIGDSISYRKYYNTIYKPGVMQNIKKYTIGLPGLILSKIAGKENSPFIDGNSNIKNSDEYFFITKEDMDLIRQITHQFHIDVNLDDGFVTLSVEMHDPLIATQMAVNFQKLVHLSLIKYKTKKTKSELDFLNNAYNEKKREFEAKQVLLSELRDSNFNLSTAIAQNKIEKAVNEVNLAFQIYSEVAIQKQQTELKLLRDTPLLTVIKPIVVPIDKAGPNRALILMFFVFLGSVAGCIVVLKKAIVQSIRQQFSND